MLKLQFSHYYRLGVWSSSGYLDGKCVAYYRDLRFSVYISILLTIWCLCSIKYMILSSIPYTLVVYSKGGKRFSISISFLLRCIESIMKRQVKVAAEHIVYTSKMGFRQMDTLICFFHKFFANQPTTTGLAQAP
jgi:hypothetical protein